MTQQNLPFGEAEGSYAERRQTLELALLRVRASRHLQRLVEVIFELTRGGKNGAYKRSYPQMVEPGHWSLRCSVATARRAVHDGIRFGILAVNPTFDSSGHQTANEYWIDWDGVADALDMTRRPGSKRSVGKLSRGAQGEQGGAQGEQGGAQGEQPYKEVKLLDSSYSPTTSPGATAADEPGDWSQVVVELKAIGVRAIDKVVGAARVRGEPVAAVLDAISAYRANLRLFKPDARGETVGGLCWRLQTGEWPDGIRPEPAHVVTDRRAAADARRRREDEERTAERIENESLERDFGTGLDALADDERRGLADRRFGHEETLWQAKFRQGGWRTPNSVVRLELLAELKARSKGQLSEARL